MRPVCQSHSSNSESGKSSMSTATVAKPPVSGEVRSQDSSRHGYDSVGLKPAKAHLKSPASDFTYGGAIWGVLVNAHGSVKEAAFAMGNTDPSLLRRQILDGTLPLKKLFEAEPKALAAFGDFLTEHFGDTQKSKQQIAREKLPELLALILDAVTEEK